jgi:hypothetical protein
LSNEQEEPLAWNDEYLFSRIAQALSESWEIMRKGDYPVDLPPVMDIFTPLIEADSDDAKALCGIPEAIKDASSIGGHQSGILDESNKRRKL